MNAPFETQHGTPLDVSEIPWQAALWRAAAAHDALGEALPRLLTIVQNPIGVVGVVIRKLEVASRQLTTSASAALGSGLPRHFTERKLLASSECARLLQCPTTDVRAGSDSALHTLLSTEKSQGFYFLPLHQAGDVAYFALLPSIANSPAPEHVLESLTVLQPVLNAAVSSDLRLRELTRRRTSLEADKTALLSRLERQDISELVIGETGGLKQVSDQLEQVARTDVPILILGETGSGKEVIARALHARSRRRSGPVVRVNCGAIPSELIDSELFGHERGAFTGAVAQRKGWFERADGGTLFLDEIGELMPAAQVRLLRVLQEGTLERVGGQQTIAVDVRIVAATHRRLELMVAEGKFREDLWYRLNVFPIALPPLRERTQDIPALAAHFARNAGRRLGLSSIDLIPSAEHHALLLSYDWPGNVRELASVIERAAILGRGKTLEVAAALGGLWKPSGRSSPTPQERLPGLETFPTLAEVTSAHIQRALILSEGQVEGKGGAAQLLDINPHTLRARMRKLSIDWVPFRDAR